MDLSKTRPPPIRLAGDFHHSDFCGVIDLLRATADVTSAPDVAPELIVVAQSIPDAVSSRTIQLLQRQAPLAGIVGLMGTWCEGETRTGRPWPGVLRRYWYEFPAWWQRQLKLRSVGRCPDWALPSDPILASPGVVSDSRGRGLAGSRTSCDYANGLVVIRTVVRDTAVALADTLQRAGYATLWQPPSRAAAMVRGAVAGIWIGGQLSEREEVCLLSFCKQLNRDRAPVIALLDFPRRERSVKARSLGATTVLAKPWLNIDLLGAVEQVMQRRRIGEVQIPRAA